jgi:putative ABC transport system permease protein
MKNGRNKAVDVAKRLLSSLLDQDYLEEFLGDLEELHQERLKRSHFLPASFLYWIDTIHLLIGFSSFHFFRQNHNPTIMLRHYFALSRRNILKNRSSSIINILGLSIGMGVCLLIYQYVDFEFSYDKFHSDALKKYRILQHDCRTAHDLGLSAFTTFGLGIKLDEEIPEIDEYVRIRPTDIGLVVSTENKNTISQENGICYADENLLMFFDFPLLSGNREICLNEKHHIVISEKIAKKYFGNQNPIGKIINISGGIYSGDFEVSAVLKNIPANSHLQFDLLLNIDVILEKNDSYREGEDGWVNSDFVTYISTFREMEEDELNDKIQTYISPFANEKIAFKELKRSYKCQPISEIHLQSNNLSKEFSSAGGDIQKIYFFIIISIFILAMAWVNYINLSTAKAIIRAKEVGIRKSIGAVRTQLMSQFLMESLIINLISVSLAILLAKILMPMLTYFVGADIPFQIITKPTFWILILIIVSAGSIISGIYPAFVLSSFNPLQVIKQKIGTQTNIRFRRSLLTIQFIISMALLSCTFLVFKQIDFMKNVNLGVEVEKIVILDGPRVVLESLTEEGTTLGAKYKIFKNMVNRHHSVLNTSSSSSIPSYDQLFTLEFRKNDAPQTSNISSDVVLVDRDFFKTYSIEFVLFDTISNSLSPYQGVFINEKALQELGFESPEDAINCEILNGSDPFVIMGVIKDFSWESPKFARKPICILINEEWGHYFSLKINLSDIQGSLKHIETCFKKVFPNDPFTYYFLEEEFNKQFQSDLRFSKLLNAFTLVAVLIACMGLFSLISYTASTRTKEIGVRKIFGASISDVVFLVSREYMIMLVFSIVICIPLIVSISNYWLNNFANRITLRLDIILIPGFVLTLITALTIGIKLYNLAKIKPVSSLRSE